MFLLIHDYSNENYSNCKEILLLSHFKYGVVLKTVGNGDMLKKTVNHPIA